MARCHPSRCGATMRGWLLTDARLAGDGIAAARRLPPGSHIVVRSDVLPPAARRLLIRRLRRIARARQCRVFIAGVSPGQAHRLGADGVHLRARSGVRAAQAQRRGLLTSAPVHDPREARAAARAAIGHALISPLYLTRSHAGAVPLTMRAFMRLARLAGAQPVALGGMTPTRFRALLRRCAGGGLIPDWAAIDAWEDARKIATA